MTKNKKILAMIKIEAGFGDISWGLRLFEEISPYHEIKIIFYNCMEKQIDFLKKNRIYQECYNLENLQYNINVYKSSQIDINGLIDIYDYIINFHFLIYNQIIHKKVINIDEYGKSTDNLRFLLKDFTKKYKQIYNMNNVETSKDSYSCNSLFISEITKSPYYLTYYAKQDYTKDIITLFYFINLVSDLSEYTKIRILTNFSFEIDNKEFKNVFDLLEEEKNTKGITSKYNILYYINQMGEYMIRKVETNRFEILKKDKIIELISYGIFSKVEYEYLLLNSEKIVGCTGDMSISECISTDRIFVYQTLPHKLNFRYILNNMFNEYSSQKDVLMNFMFDPCMIEKRNELNFKQFCKEWKYFYENIIKTNNFTDWILALIK